MLKRNGRQVAITPSYEGHIHRFRFRPEATGKHVFRILPQKLSWLQRIKVCVLMVCLRLSLWRLLFPHQPPLLFHEDNQAMIRVVSIWQEPYDALPGAYASRLCGMATCSASYERDSDGIRRNESDVR